MLITICDVPEHFAPEIADAGGVVVRKWDGLMDVQFSEHLMDVYNTHIELRNKNRFSLVLADNEFSRIYIQ